MSETDVVRLLFSYGLLLFVLGDRAVGCSCSPIPPTPCEAAKVAVVFRGRLVETIPIVDAPPPPGVPPPPPTGVRYRFDVAEDFSGVGQTSIELVRTVMTSCDASFSVGTEYVVYARRSGSGEINPEFKCGRTRPVENADADLQYLRRLFFQRTVLAGTLRTPAGFVAGERVVATSSSTLNSFETRTNKEGLFQFLGLPAGKYKLSVARHPELREFTADVNVGVCSIVNSKP